MAEETSASSPGSELPSRTAGDAYITSVLEALRDDPYAFSPMALRGIASRVLDAWNARTPAVKLESGQGSEVADEVK